MRTVHVHWFRRCIQGSCVLLGCLHFCECFSMRYCFTEMHCERFKKNDLQCISFSFATVVNVFKCMICNAFERFQNALKWKNGSTEFSLSLVFPNRVTFNDFFITINIYQFVARFLSSHRSSLFFYPYIFILFYLFIILLFCHTQWITSRIKR